MKTNRTTNTLSLCLLFAALALFGACSKNSGGDNDGGDGSANYFMRFKVDGQAVEYLQAKETNINSYLSVATSAPAQTGYVSFIVGQKDIVSATQQKNALSFALSTNAKLKVNTTYTNYASAGSEYLDGVKMIFGYTDAAGTIHLAWSSELAAQIYQAYSITVLSDSRVAITEIGTDYIKGNFSGTLYSEDYKTKKVLSEGSFYLYFDQH